MAYIGVDKFELYLAHVKKSLEKKYYIILTIDRSVEVASVCPVAISVIGVNSHFLSDGQSFSHYALN